MFATRGGLDSVAKFALNGAETGFFWGAKQKVGVHGLKLASLFGSPGGDALTVAPQRNEFR